MAGKDEDDYDDDEVLGKKKETFSGRLVEK